MTQKQIGNSMIETEWNHSQYWAGAGLLNFEDVATGIGASVREAAEDACEQLAQNGWDTSYIDLDAFSTDDTQICECGRGKDARYEECEHHYFTTIRVDGKEEEVSAKYTLRELAGGWAVDAVHPIVNSRLAVFANSPSLADFSAQTRAKIFIRALELADADASIERPLGRVK